MDLRLPEKFERRTRWAYLKGSVEVGPYSAREILDLLLQKKIGPQTEVVELVGRRTCPLIEVKPFQDFVRQVVDFERHKKAAQEVEETHERLQRQHRNRLLLIAVAGALVGAVIVALVLIFKPFGSGERVRVIDGSQKLPRPPDGGQKAAAPVEPEIVEPAGDGPEGEEAAVLKTIQQEERKNVATTDALREPGTKLQEIKVKRVRPPGHGAHAPLAGTPGAAGLEGTEGGEEGEEEGMTTLDFSEEEEGTDTATMARDRLAGVVRACAEGIVQQFDDVPVLEVEATVTLEPSGRMKGLKLTVTPPAHVGDLKMCASADLPAQRVPAFTGSEMTVTARVQATR
jgi:hypothetical protein